MLRRTILLVVIFIPLIARVSMAAELERIADVKLELDFEHDEDVSGIAIVDEGKFLVVGNDEDNELVVLRRTGDNEYEAHKKIQLVANTEDEIDIEGVACHQKTVYVIGSHSRKRTKVDPEKTQKKNRERLTENEVEPLRESLFRFKLDDEGQLASKIEMTSLRKRMDEDPILKPFLQIPSKEGGLDIEGIATDGDKLYVGFRGPVLRGGYIPVLVLDFDKPNKSEMLFVNLGGRGIRDIVATDAGFLIIGGPVGDEPVSYELYHWDGEDGVEGKDVDVEEPESIGRIPLPPTAEDPMKKAKAEGITLLGDDALIVFDSAKDGGAGRFRLRGND